MFFIEDLGSLVLWLIALVMSLNFVFLFFVFYRRLSRQRYFAEKDAARERYLETIKEFAANELTLEEGSLRLAHAVSAAERDAVQQMLSAEVNRNNAERISQLFLALGFVDVWAKQVFGRRAADLVRRSMAGEQAKVETGERSGMWDFVSRLRIFAVPRAIAMDSLGRIAPRHAQIFLSEGLHDPSTFVRRVAVENMGRNRFPEAVPLLIEELRRAVEEGNDVSLRTMKAALISYELEDLEHFIPFLTQPNRRARFFVIDTLREICNRASQNALLTKNDFSPALCKVVLEHCVVDDFEDVRARSAYVVRHFRDQNAIEALRKLMRDPNEYVRLHSVRACANRFFLDLAPDVVARLTDVRWRVREAAVGTLAALGPAGRDEMYRFFVGCTDSFACEQVTEELQRKGLVPDLVAGLAQGGQPAALARAVCQKMAMLGKTSLLITAMATSSSLEARMDLIEALAISQSEEYVSVLAMIAQTQSGVLRAKAAEYLHKSESGVFRSKPQSAGQN